MVHSPARALPHSPLRGAAGSLRGRIGLVLAVASLGALWLVLSPRAPEALPTLSPTVARRVAGSRLPEPESGGWMARAEQLYRRGLDRRRGALENLINGRFDPWDVMRGVYIWDWFAPDFSCPSVERLGRLGDGGKWVCEPDALGSSPNCVVYSFGARDDVTFEQEILSRSAGRCEVHVFDPTVGGLPRYAAPELHFHKAALSAHPGKDRTWPVANSLLGHMASLGHSHLSLLKIDCEGCEWAVFEALNEAGLAMPFDQLLVELHLGNSSSSAAIQERMFELFGHLEAVNMRAFAREVNIGPTLTGQLPTACEYSFIRNKLLPAEPARLSPRLLFSKPTRLRAAIYFLVNTGRLSQLVITLRQLHLHFNAQYRYPIVLFHESGLSTEAQQMLTMDGQWSWVRFAQVELSLGALEPSLKPESVPESTECGPRQLSYRHMCRFHAIEASKLLSAMGFEWHWRLDDDSRLPSPIGYDVFEMMATNNMLYSYVSVVQEEPKCVSGLWELAQDHLSDTETEASFFYEWPIEAVFYNNFEISHATVWQSAPVQRWMDSVRKAGGIYTHRWGDAPIRTLAVAMFVDPFRVHRFSDLGYSHAPLFEQAAGSLPMLGSSVVQSALCAHIIYWHLPGNSSAVASDTQCKPLLSHQDIRYPLQSAASNRKPRSLTSAAAFCNVPLLSAHQTQKCALPVEPGQPTAVDLNGWRLVPQAVPGLVRALGVQLQGMLGSDIATSIQLPPLLNGRQTDEPRMLWLLGDTVWGRYDAQACSREGKALPRNAFVVSQANSSCLHLQMGAGGLAVDLLKPPGRTDRQVHQEHWWWIFTGLMLNRRLYLLGADFWLAPHTMFSSQGTLVFIVQNPEAPVNGWKYTRSYMNKQRNLHWYSGIAQQGEWVYLAGSWEDASTARKIESRHGVELEKGLVMSRISTADFEALDWDQIQYWSGHNWNQHPAPASPNSVPALAPVLFHTGGGETSLTFDERLKLWYMLFSQQHDSNQIMLHYASKVEGPWLNMVLYQPPAPFSDTKAYMCYAVKSHPALAQANQMIISYVCTKRPWTFPGMTNVYVPQFVSVSIEYLGDQLAQPVKPVPVARATLAHNHTLPIESSD